MIELHQFRITLDIASFRNRTNHTKRQFIDNVKQTNSQFIDKFAIWGWFKVDSNQDNATTPSVL